MYQSFGFDGVVGSNLTPPNAARSYGILITPPELFDAAPAPLVASGTVPAAPMTSPNAIAAITPRVERRRPPRPADITVRRAIGVCPPLPISCAHGHATGVGAP